MLRHRDRLRRVYQKARAVAGMTAIAAPAENREVITKSLGAVLVPSLALTMIAIFLFEADVLSCLPALGLVTIAAVWTVINARKSFAAIKRLVDDARTESIGEVQSLLATESVMCSSCGGYSAVLALSVSDGVPCPWCSVELVAIGTTRTLSI